MASSSNEASQSSRRSQTSVQSIGMGAGPPDGDYIPRLFAEGYLPENQSTYDCVLYLFLCEEHNRIGVYNVDRTKVVWLPFVAVQFGVAWEQTAEDGLELFLSTRQEETVDLKNPATRLPKNGANLPRYKMSTLHFLRIQLASEKFEVRITQLVRIFKTDG